jgi:hypothetical protein
MSVKRGYVPLKHSERRPRGGARLLGPADPDEELSVSVRVRRRGDGPALPTVVPRGRGVLSRQAFADRFGASDRDLEQVAAFGRSHGMAVTELSVPRRTVVLSGTVQQASRAFGVELGRYETEQEAYRGREGMIHVPAHLAPIIEGVFGLDNRRMARRVGAMAQPGQTVSLLTPPQVAALYDFPTGSNGTGQTIGLIEFLGGYQLSDANAFFGSLGLPTPQLTAVEVDGEPNLPGDPDADSEVELDLEVAGAIAPGASITLYFTPWTEQGWVDVITTAVHDTTNAPSVLSISWGWAENESAGDVAWSPAAVEAVSTTFWEAAQLGITVFAASGDNGSDCKIGDRRAHVNYPTSDPFVTACGGTTISNVSGSSFTETTWAATGGGVSYLFDPQPWQAWAGVPASVNGDGRLGRGVPDIAGNADPNSGYTVVVDGLTGAGGGTSAVAPLYAGLVALLNAALGEPVGYLNPILYTFAEGYVFSDISDGISNASAGAPGYNSGPGWDACTGLGRIDGNALLLSLRGLGLPPAVAQLTQDTFYMAWKGMEFDDTIWWSTFDGTNWAPQRRVPSVLTSSGVALAEFNGRLFMAWKGSFEGAAPFDERIFWTTFDGKSWAPQRQVPDVWTSAGPQLAALGDQLYMVWKGEYTDESLWWTSFDGKQWAPQQVIPGVGTSVGAGVAAFQDLLFAAWKGIDGDPRLWWSSFDGSTWAPQRQIPEVASSHGPSLCVYNGWLYAGWKGWFDDPGIYWSSFDGTSWTPQVQIPDVGTSVGPSLIGFDDALYAVWKGEYGDQSIYWSSFDGGIWAPQQSVPSVGTSPDL